MKSDDVETTLKHPKQLMVMLRIYVKGYKMKDKENTTFT